MGVVYRARQTRLGRLVALKMIRDGAQANDQSRSRFRQEATTLARLQHPHIVQVFDLDWHEGQGFLALELVEGGSLADRLDGTPQPLRPAAELVETLARAIHCAHQQGIIHRDLKPANILLTANGQPKITDFGLAKLRAGGPGLSESGAILGTASYMPPEQAQGNNNDIGPAADVYALGAILYELLTGRPPFKATSSLETIRQVINLEPVLPRQLRPELPRDLQTICLKCLRKEPGKRYAIAMELADDLRRFLAGEPVRARPAGVVERCVRWARRRPAVAALAGVGALAVVSLLTLTLWYVTSLRWYNRELATQLHRVERQRERTERERQRSQANLDQALGLLDRIVLGDPDPADGLRLDHRRLKELRHALSLYLAMLRANRSNPLVLQKTARAYERVGAVEFLLGHRGPAEKALGRSVALLTRLRAASANYPGYRYDLGTTWNTLGRLLRDNRPGEAESCFRTAVRLLESLRREFPKEPHYPESLARSYHNLGNLLGDRGRPDAARAVYRRAVALHRRLVQRFPANRLYRRNLIRHRVKLGYLLRRIDPGRAERIYRRALADQEALLREKPKDPAFRDELAQLYHQLGNLLQKTAPRKAEDSYRRAVEHHRALAARFPQVPRYAYALAGHHQNLGDLFLREKQLPQARAAFDKALTFYRTLAADFPQNAAYQGNLGFTHEKLANTHERAAALHGDPGAREKVLHHLNRAIPRLRTALKLGSRNPTFRKILRDSYRLLAQTRLRRREYEPGTAAAEHMLRVFPGSARDALQGAEFFGTCATLAAKDQSLPEARRRALARQYAGRALELFQQALRGVLPGGHD
jgi:serine/threonine-protein kinase